MDSIKVHIKFKKLADKSGGEIKIAYNREGIYSIYVDSTLPKMTQVGLLIHELTHMISDMFFGLLDLGIPEESLCEEMEKTLTSTLTKRLKRWQPELKKGGAKKRRGHEQ